MSVCVGSVADMCEKEKICPAGYEVSFRALPSSNVGYCGQRVLLAESV
jgi:hypothetical protein